MARPRLGNAPLSAAERQRRRRERLKTKRDAERSHEMAEVERLTAELATMTRSRDHWEKQVKGLKAKLKQAETDKWQLANRPSYAFSADSLDMDIWRSMLQLAHPDKNSNREAATKVTSWLLQHKPRSRVAD